MDKIRYTLPLVEEISIEESLFLCVSETRGDATVIGYDYDSTTYDELD